MNRPLKAALVALLGLSASLGTSHAQATASYSAGDLLLGFRASDGTGATKNYVVNLGSAETLSTLSTPKLFGADGAIATDLASVFGADWSTRSDLHWSVSGTTGSFAPVGSIPAKTLFATLAESTPGTYETNVWTRGSSTAQGVVTSKMNSFASAFKSYAPTANNPLGVIQNQTDANSYGSFQKGGTLPNSGPAPGISFAYFNPSIEANFAAGASASILDLVKLEPATSEFVGAQGTLLGRFAISTTGTVTFTPKGYGENPPTIASQPQSTGLNTGGSARLVVTAGTSDGVSYQWSKDGAPIAGATSSSYLATAAGSYTVTLTNPSGSVTSGAAVVSTVTSPTLGQLFLGFRASDGTGATKNYLVKLGSASNFTNGTSIASFGSDGSIAKDLADLFGADWSTRSDVYWSVSGTTGSFQSLGGLPAKTLFASIAEATPGTFETNLWKRASSTAQGIVTSKMNSLSTAFAGSSVSPNNALGVIQNQTDSNSYGSFQKGGTLANSGPSPGISFAYFNPSIEANFQAGAANSILDLVQIEPGSGESIGAAGSLLGRFKISPSGVISFIPKDTVEVAPSITTQPLASSTITFGGSQTLSVTTANAESASFQWFKNGSLIQGANSSSLLVSAPGSYTVSVTTVSGSVTSNAAKISVTGNGASIEPTGVLSGNVKGSVALAGAEIPAFDPLSKRAFASSSTGVQVVDLTNPSNPTFLSTIAPASLGVAGLTSNDVSSINVRKGTNGNPSVLAIAVINSPKTSPGHVVFVRADTGALLGAVQVGVVPDHVTFTPDGTKVLVANEGELDGTAATIPDAADGSVSIIDVSAGFSTPTVKTAGFSAWDSSNSIAALRAAGVRIFENGIPSKDFEPEYIGVSADSTKAFVTLQEANAIGILDLGTGAFTDIVPLGQKDFSTGFHDFSDKDGTGGTALINLTTGNPVKGLYMPDAVASFTSQGQTYYVIANEGDDRNDFLTPDETTTVGSASYVLDPTKFPNASSLKQLSSLGRLVVSNANGLRGDTDGDGDIDEILSYGGRSFSILDAQGNMVFDSGDMIERIVSTKYASSFDDGRSDNKGPEPEGVTVATVGGVPYAFVGLERSSLVLVFDLTNPLQPVFVNGIKRTGDTSPEGLMVVSEADAPEGKPLLLVTNEVSNTLSVFELGGSQVSIGNASIAEGNSGTKTLNLAVTRGSGASGFTVGYAVTGGTAAAGTDYTLASGTLTFTSGGSDSQNIAITVNGDNVVETDETVLVSLSNVVNVTGQTTIGAATGTATITNDDIAPVIATQPSAPAGGILESGGTTLAVSATGTGLSYQWKKDGSDIVGATAASYTATTSGSYTVVITNAAGSVTSAAIVLTSPVTQPVITVQPSGGVLANGSATLSVTATGSGLTYQWKKDGVDVSGATSASYTANAAGTYSVVVTNTAGSATSSNAIVTAPVTLPVITVQPSSGVLANGSATLSVTATGAGLTYQWSRGSAVLLGANASEFTAFVTGSYSVTVTNSAGSVTSQTAVVTAEVKPSIDLASITGEFQGLLEPVSSSDAGQHGLITATIAKPIGKNQVSVMVSGKVRRASGTQSFIGRIDASGNVAFTSNNLPWLNISGTNGARLTLEVVASSGGSVIEGKLTRAGVDLAELTAKRTVVPTTSQRGRYTAGLELEEGQASGLPEGDGHATTFVSATGAAFVARLADGSSTSSAMKITESDDAPLFAPLYSGKGLLLGMVRFAQNESGNDASSAGMRWFRSANLLSPSGFKDGWPTGLLLNLAAEKYDSTKGFGLANVSGLTLNFSAEGADLVNDVSGVVTLSSKNVLTATPGSVKLSTALNATTGLITGSFTLPNAKVATKFSAVVLQKSGAATGFFINGSGLQTKSGLIQITE
jgi:hypothetical protein